MDKESSKMGGIKILGIVGSQRKHSCNRYWLSGQFRSCGPRWSAWSSSIAQQQEPSSGRPHEEGRNAAPQVRLAWRNGNWLPFMGADQALREWFAAWKFSDRHRSGNYAGRCCQSGLYGNDWFRSRALSTPLPTTIERPGRVKQHSTSTACRK